MKQVAACKMIVNRFESMFLFPPLIFAQVEARKAEILREIREMLSASAKVQPTKVNIAWHF